VPSAREHLISHVTYPIQTLLSYHRTPSGARSGHGSCIQPVSGGDKPGRV